MEQKNISTLNLGDAVDGYYVIGKIVKRTCVKGDYLTGQLSDNTGEIGVILWNYDGTITPTDNGKILYINGNVTEYGGANQVTAVEIRHINEFDDVNISEILPTAPVDVNIMCPYLNGMISTITDPDYRRTCSEILSENKEAFCSYPAAMSVHDAVIHGLIHHTYKMARAAENISEIYKDSIDRDLLLTGILLHDIGKIKEFAVNEYGLVADYTDDGKFKGHLLLGAEMVRAKATELGVNEEKIKLLENIILSHHGKPEYGAAAQPLTLEAQIVHQIDMLDSRIAAGIEIIKNVHEGDFSQKVFALDNVRLYRHVS